MTHSPDHAERAREIEQLRQRLAEASAQPWVYRPNKHDDWGWIRGVERDDRDIGPFRPIVANAKDSMVGEAAMAEHRRAGTDPYGPNALLIVEAVNALPWLLDLASAALHDAKGLDLLFYAYRAGFNDGDEGNWEPDTVLTRALHDAKEAGE